MKPHVKEIIVVEGRYDKNTVSQVVDATIIETGGFGIFSNSEKLSLLRRFSDKCGLIIMTDSDGAGFVIRNYLKGALNGKNVKHAYIPDLRGKERRKSARSKEGLLGVEGMEPSLILDALCKCGATIDSETQPVKRAGLTKSDMYELGLSGNAGSAERRKLLLKKLGLPEKLSANALLDVINALYSRDEIRNLV